MAVTVDASVTVSWTLPSNRSCQSIFIRVALSAADITQYVYGTNLINATFSGLACGTTYNITVNVPGNNIIAGPAVTTEGKYM